MLGIKTKLEDLKGPATIAGGSIVASFLSRKLTGHQLGINTQSAMGAFKAFLTITLAGGLMVEAVKRGDLPS